MSMRVHSRFVIAFSGPSGAGKSTLVEKVAARLSDATPLFYDNYATVARWHPDVRRWVEQGCDPNQWVSIPELVADVPCLREGRAIDLPGGAGVVTPARYIVLEEPWGRDREELQPWIDFVVHVDIPLDISLCRKLLREYARPNPDRDPLAFVSDYLTLHLGDVYRRQQQTGEHADLVVDGLRPPDETAAFIVETILRSDRAES